MGRAARLGARVSEALVSALLLGVAPGCGHPPATSVVRAAEIGTLQSSPLIVGRDGACSMQAWGHELWAFGDTFLSVPNAQGYQFVSNTFALSAAQLADGGLPLADRLDDAGAPEQLLVPTADEQAYDDAHRMLSDGGCAQAPCGGRRATWPAAMVYDPASQSAVVFYSLITAAPGDFNFSGVGQSVALWSDFDVLPARPAPALCPGEPLALFCEGEPSFGTAAVLEGGTLYAFGCVRDFLSFPCQLGRVPFAQAAERGAWQFWSGSGWSAELAASRPVFEGASIMQLFFNDHVGQWMAIYAQTLSNSVVFRTAPALTGPWSDEGALFTADRRDAGGTTYDALPHPELAEQGGQIQYVTYSRATGLFSSEFALVRVEFR